jgi:hypothetical protein
MWENKVTSNIKIALNYINSSKSLNKQTTEHLNNKNNNDDKNKDKSNKVIKTAVF